VKEIVAIPEEFVVDVAVAKDPLALLLLQVTVLPEVATAFPLASVSWAEIVTAAPAVGEYVDEVTMYLLAAPAVMASELEVTALRDAGVKVRVKLPAVPVITRLVNVAIPDDAVTVVVPESVPVPEAIDATTLTVEEVTVLPLASTIRITGWVASWDPLAAPVGCVVIAAAVSAAATVNVNACVALPEALVAVTV